MSNKVTQNKPRKPLSLKKLQRLEKIITKFVDEQRITCAESIWDCDKVIENGYDFIRKLTEVVGYFKYPEDK